MTAPSQPLPMQPAPSQPPPVQPLPMQPAPGGGTGPAPMIPAPAPSPAVQPLPMQPAPSQPAPSQPLPMQPAPRGLARDWLACCAAEAVAMSLRLAGGSVTAGDVEALYWLTAASASAGASILATLEAAPAWGLAGYKPGGPLLGIRFSGGRHTVLEDCGFWWSWGRRHDPADFPGAVIEESWTVTW